MNLFQIYNNNNASYQTQLSCDYLKSAQDSNRKPYLMINTSLGINYKMTYVLNIKRCGNL